MYLTAENAHEYVGKTLDSSRRLFHHYPLYVVYSESMGYFVKDKTGTYMPIPSEKDTFNRFYFDIVKEK